MQRWAKAAELQRMFEANHADLLRFKDKHAEKTIYCLGTGPSLANEDLSLLDGKPVVLTNHAYLALDRFTPGDAVGVVTDYHRTREMRPLLETFDFPVFTATDKFNEDWFDLSIYAPPLILLMPKVVWIASDEGPKPIAHFGLGFSEDLTSHVYTGLSVIFTALQIAAFMGAKNLVMLGVDMDYSTRGDYFDRRIPTPETKKIDYQNDTRDMLIYARGFLEGSGRRLINATTGGKVDVVGRLPLAQVRERFDP